MPPHLFTESLVRDHLQRLHADAERRRLVADVLAQRHPARRRRARFGLARVLVRSGLRLAGERRDQDTSVVSDVLELRGPPASLYNPDGVPVTSRRHAA